MKVKGDREQASDVEYLVFAMTKSPIVLKTHVNDDLSPIDRQ